MIFYILLFAFVPFFHAANIIQATGLEQDFVLTCDSTNVDDTTSEDTSDATKLKLIKDGTCLEESDSGSISLRIQVSDYVYGSYYCVEENLSQKSRVIQSQIIIKPAKFVFSTDTIRGIVRILSGNSFNYICKSIKSAKTQKSNIKLVRSQTGEVIKQSSSSGNLRASTMFKNLQQTNSGVLQCQLSNVFDGSTRRLCYPKPECTYDVEAQLIVYDPVKYDEYSQRTYSSGDNIAFIGAPADSIWIFENSHLLPMKSKQSISVQNGVLYIANISPSESGRYNVIMPTRTFVINLNVDQKNDVNTDSDYDIIQQGTVPQTKIVCPQRPNPPQVLNPEDIDIVKNIPGESPSSDSAGKVYRLDVSSSFTYMCESFGPGIEQMYFQKDGMIILPTKVEQMFQNKIQAHLIIPSVSFNDAGNYMCVMQFKNGDGSSSKRTLSFSLFVNPRQSS